MDEAGSGVDFGAAPASSEARQVVEWVLGRADNQGLPFIIVDKVNASVFVFDAGGLLLGATPALLGLARGDVSPDGIGNRRLSKILPDERITPAGRFVTTAGTNLAQKEILWIDYESSLSLHPVITTNRTEKRAERLETPSALDNRISFGCINVPVKFYDTIIKNAFVNRVGITYIIPEHKSIKDVFFMISEDSVIREGQTHHE